MSNRENAQILRQVAKAIEFEEQVSTTQSNIVSVTLIQETDVNIFTQKILSTVGELEKNGKVKVSVQYSTALASSTTGQMLIHSALLIGRA